MRPWGVATSTIGSSQNRPREPLRMISTACPRCAQAVIQAGIRRVIFLREKPHHAGANAAAVKMFTASGVVCEALEAVDAGASDWSQRLGHFMTTDKPSEDDV